MKLSTLSTDQFILSAKQSKNVAKVFRMGLLNEK